MHACLGTSRPARSVPRASRKSSHIHPIGLHLVSILAPERQRTDASTVRIDGGDYFVVVGMMASSSSNHNNPPSYRNPNPSHTTAQTVGPAQSSSNLKRSVLAAFEGEFRFPTSFIVFVWEEIGGLLGCIYLHSCSLPPLATPL